MAIINKINEKSGLVVGVIAGALVLFLLTDLVFSPNSIFSSQSDDVGEIAGKDISLKDYTYQVHKVENQYALNNRPVTENDRPQIQDQAWSEMIMKIAYAQQFDKLGLTVTPEELESMITGKHLHPSILQSFQNPETKQFDINQLKNFLKNIESGQADPRTVAMWNNFRAEIGPERLRTKYMNLFRMSEYVTKAEAEREFRNQNTKADLKYLFVSYYTLPDSSFKVTDDQIQAYINKNEARYKVEEGRSLDYVVFPIVVSSKDSAELKKDLSKITRDFASSTDDTSFVAANSDNVSEPGYKYINELPMQLKDSLNFIQKGKVYGPYNEYSKYVIYKVIDIKEDPKDSNYVARAKHILLGTKDKMTRQDYSQPMKDSIKKKANELLAKIKAGANFEEMVKQYSTDEGSKVSGGDLNWFGQTQMVKPFSDAVFNMNKPGLVATLVESEYGYHIIKVTEAKTNKKFLMATVEKEIGPSDETKDIAYRKATSFASSVEDTAAFNALAKKENVFKYSAKNIKKNDRYINNLNNVREIIRWAYDSKVGTVSNVFEMENQYVVAILTGKRSKGLARPEDVREEVAVKVRNEMKGDKILEKLNASKGDIDQLAAAYGPTATVNTAQATFGSSSLETLGNDPEAIGKAFALKEGQRTIPFKGENGVVVLQLIKNYPVVEIADYGMYKTQISQQRVGQTDYKVDEAIKKDADIEDNRYKFF
ncbi:MAG: peptidylprolyl isomerase [Cytophagaceae bacterium]